MLFDLRNMKMESSIMTILRRGFVNGIMTDFRLARGFGCGTKRRLIIEVGAVHKIGLSIRVHFDSVRFYSK